MISQSNRKYAEREKEGTVRRRNLHTNIFLPNYLHIERIKTFCFTRKRELNCLKKLCHQKYIALLLHHHVTVVMRTVDNKTELKSFSKTETDKDRRKRRDRHDAIVIK